MEIRVLGPLHIVDDNGRSIPLAPKARQVFGVLATHADLAVRNSCIIDELWEGLPPRTAMATLQTYVAQIRRALSAATGESPGRVAADVLITIGGGYQLSTERVFLDTVEYARLDGEGRLAARMGKFSRASRLLRDALALWRGPALANVEQGHLLGAQAARMEECRLNTEETRIQAELQLGEHRALVAELSSLVASYPHHEALHRHLILALYRCGRRVEALGVMRDLRRRLAVDLGLDVSAPLTELEGEILTGSPALDLVVPEEDLGEPALITGGVGRPRTGRQDRTDTGGSPQCA